MGRKGSPLSQALQVSRLPPLGAPMHSGSPPHSRMEQTKSGGTQPVRAQIPRNSGSGGGAARVPTVAGGGSALAGANVIVAPLPSELKGSLRTHGSKTNAAARRQLTPIPAEQYELPSPPGRSSGNRLELFFGAEPIARKVEQKQTGTERIVAHHRPKAAVKDSLVAQWLSIHL
tara:strand:+ start:430 stop:951 length:522 start_codon:yes stop_codon:yes gene_type:complete